jgi:DNA-binding IclR family transcriptional regulator
MVAILPPFLSPPSDSDRPLSLWEMILSVDTDDAAPTRGIERSGDNRAKYFLHSQLYVSMDAIRPTDFEPNQDSLETVGRTCEIIYTVAELETATLGAITEQTGYSKSMVYKHLQTLIRNHFVVRRDEETPHEVADPPEYPTYELSFGFLEFGDRLRRSVLPLSTIDATLERLAAETGQLAQFATAEYGQVVYLLHEAGDDFAALNPVLGARDPIYSTSFGKAIVSQYDDEVVQKPVIPFRTLDERPDPDSQRVTAFHETIRDVRDRGYAIDDEETRTGVRSVAAPVTVEGRLVGAVGLSGAPSYFTDSTIASTLGPTVMRAAECIEIEENNDW